MRKILMAVVAVFGFAHGAHALGWDDLTPAELVFGDEIAIEFKAVACHQNPTTVHNAIKLSVIAAQRAGISKEHILDIGQNMRIDQPDCSTASAQLMNIMAIHFDIMMEQEGQH